MSEQFEQYLRRWRDKTGKDIDELRATAMAYSVMSYYVKAEQNDNDTNINDTSRIKVVAIEPEDKGC